MQPRPGETAPGAGRERVALTPRAAQQLRRLRARHGELMFHQSGGCCDGSSPMCFPDGDFLLSEADEHLGDLLVPADEGQDAFTVGVWMSKEQHARWAHTHLTIDLVPGRGAGFSLEAPDGVRFLIRSRLLEGPGGPASCELPGAAPDAVSDGGTGVSRIGSSTAPA
ncbi:DUF779 domain-containing protein [Kineococcus sp. T13]|uniref:DUF779 domain-containing protein n=1 Tax=Kineococcus vitellinus TaxID=2696565 RepID=UPI00141277EC|nr:DUF779 domain-containing protein [Kineococcus vitellinus]NAZ74540.1 DUF779 domain-containing protein [Kineococcus vitellinus]